MTRLPASLRLLGAYLRANLQGALEYRASFASDVLSMLINNTMWIIFWVSFFERFPAVPGWGRPQIVTLWALVAAAVGLATTVFGNATRLAGLIARGELDFFLALPRPALFHVLVARMGPSALGDVLFGVAAFGACAQPGAIDWALFALLSVSGAGIVVGFCVAIGSLGFWLGNAEGLAQQAFNVLVNFSTYPTSIFRGASKILLFTVLPAGFLSFVPVEIVREHRWGWLAGHLAVSAAFVALGSFVFSRGLRRYESGSLFVARA